MTDRSLDVFPTGNDERELQPDQDKSDVGQGKLEADVEGGADRGDVTSPVAGEAKEGNDADRQVAKEQDVSRPSEPAVREGSIVAADISNEGNSQDLQTSPSDEDNLALDVLPSSDDIEVANYNDHLKETMKLQQYTQTLMVVARYLYIATLALATDAQHLTKAQDLLFTSLKLCDKTALMLQSFQSSANNILEKLKIAYLYCMDGFEDFARTDIEATKNDVETMRQSVKKTQHLLGDLRSRITDVQKTVGDESVKLERAGVVAPGRVQDESVESFGEDENRFRSCKGDKELIEEREKRSPLKMADVEQSSQLELGLPAYCAWIVLGLATLALIFVVMNVIDEYDSIWPDIDNVHPLMLIATISCLGLLFLFLGIFDACIPAFPFVKYINIIVVVSIALVYLQILDSHFLWWSAPNNNWISFPVVVLLLIVDAICVKLLCQCGRPVVFPNNIVSITSARSRVGRGCNNHDMKTTAGEVDNESVTGTNGETDVDEVERKSIQLQYGRFKLTEAVLREAASNLVVASGLLDGLVPVVEGWFRECEDVLEPAMKQGISASESMSAEDRKEYWNSMVFKKEVTSYYCRWRALQVYSENTRPKLQTARQRIEQFYTENPYPREAVESAWKMAAEETVPEIRHLVISFKSDNRTPRTCGVVHE
ncbi:uncharacterized protein LOC135498202 [Lineus longissimus]|uniref:uncharacterized protein LOC135498202 n=1 Tax=Lineus longissimus TaxID=88925 RepID=UPI00315D5966